MATEDEAREAADGTEVQVEAVDLGTVHLQAHPDVKVSSIIEIKKAVEIIDSTEGTLKVPEDQVLVEASSEVELPPEHKLNGKDSSLNGHMDKEKISNDQPLENDQEEAELDGKSAHQSNGIHKEKVTDSLSHGESITEDSSLLKHEKDEEPQGDAQKDLEGVTVDDDSMQEDTLKTESAIEQTDDGQPDQNKEPEKENEDTQPASIANNANVEVVAEALSGTQTPVEPHLDDSGEVPGSIDEKPEPAEPAEDCVVHLDNNASLPEDTSIAEPIEEVIKVEDQQSQKDDTMDADVVQEEMLTCEKTDVQEEVPKSEHADEPATDAHEVLNQESTKETDGTVDEKIEDTAHQSNMEVPEETTAMEPPVNIQAQNQESLEEIEDTEAVNPEAAIQQRSIAFEEVIPEEQHDLGITVDGGTVQEDTLETIEKTEDVQQYQDVGPEKTTENTQHESMANIPEVEVIAEAPSGVQTPVDINLDNSDENIGTDESAKADGDSHPDHKVGFSKDTSIAEPIEEVVKVEDQKNQQADAMDEDVVKKEVPKSEQDDEPATGTQELLNQESTEETDGPVNRKIEETEHKSYMTPPEETTPEHDAQPRDTPVNIQMQNQESSEEIEDAKVDEPTCDSQEVDNAESTEETKGSIAESIVEVSDVVMVDNEVEEQNVLPTDDATETHMPEPEPEETKNTEPVKTEDPSNHMNAVLFNDSSQGDNTPESEIHKAESATETTETETAPQESDACVSEDIATEDNSTIKPEADHKKLQDQESADFKEIDKPKEIASSSTISTCEQSTSKYNATATEQNIQAEKSDTPEGTEGTEDVKSDTALAKVAAPEENVETDATADMSPGQEPELQGTKDAEPAGTEDILTSDDLSAEKMDVETTEAEVVPHESHVTSINELTEDGNEKVQETEPVEDTQDTNTTEQPEEPYGSPDELTPTEENPAVIEPTFDTQQVQNLTSQEIKDSKDAKTDKFSDLSSFPTPEEADQECKVQELGSTEITRDIESMGTEDHHEHGVSTLEDHSEPNVDDEQVHEDKVSEVKDNEAMEAKKVVQESNIDIPDDAAEEMSELRSEPDSYVQPAQQVELCKDNENSQLVKEQETSGQINIISLEETPTTEDSVANEIDPSVDIKQDHEQEPVEEIKGNDENKAEEEIHTSQIDAIEKPASEDNITSIETTYDIKQENELEAAKERNSIEAINDGEQTENATSEDPFPTENETAQEGHPAVLNEQTMGIETDNAMLVPGIKDGIQATLELQGYAEDDSTVDEPHNNDFPQTLKDSVEVKDTISTTEEVTVEDSVTAEEPTCDSQEVDNAESAEETKGSIAENIVEVSNVVIVDNAAEEQHVLPTEDAAETHMPEPEPEETKNIESAETEEPSNQTNAVLFNDSAQGDNVPESEMQQAESATEMTETETAPQESYACVSEEKHGHMIESETNCDTQEVSITESLEAIDSDKEIITGTISGRNNIVSTRESAQISNVPESDAQSEEQATEEIASEPQVLEPESGKEMNETETTEPQNISQDNIISISGESVPEDIATEDNSTIESEANHKKLQDQESTEFKEIEDDKPQEIASSSTLSTSEQSTSNDNAIATEQNIQAENSEQAEGTEGTEHVRSDTALAEVAAPEENLETNATADMSPVQEPELQETKDAEAEPAGTEDIMISDDLLAEKMDMKTMETEVVPHESHVTSTNELTEDAIEPVLELEPVEDTQGTNTMEHPGEQTENATLEDPSPTKNETAQEEHPAELNEQTMGIETEDAILVPGIKDEIQTSLEPQDDACDFGETVLTTQESENVTGEDAVQSPGDDILDTSNNTDQVKEEQKDGCEHNSSEMSGMQTEDNIINVQDRDISGDLFTKMGTEDASEALFESDPQGTQEVTKKDDTIEGGEQTSDINSQPDDVAFQLHACEEDALSIGKQDEVVQKVDLDQQQKEGENIESQKEELQTDEQKHEDKGDDFTSEPLVESEGIENDPTYRTEDTNPCEAEQTETASKHEEAPHASEESAPISMEMQESTEKDDIVEKDSKDEQGEITGEITNEELEPDLASSGQEASDPAPSNDNILQSDPASITQNVESREHIEDKECTDKVNDDVHAIQASEEKIADELEENKEMQNEENANHHNESETKPEEEEAPQLPSNEPCNVDAKTDDTTTLDEEIVPDNASINPREIEEIGESKGLDSTSEPLVESSVQNNVEQDLNSHHKGVTQVDGEKLSMTEQNAVDIEAMQEKADAVTINDNITDEGSGADGGPSDGSLQTFNTGRGLDISSMITASKEENVNGNMEDNKLALPAQGENTLEQAPCLEKTEREMLSSEKLLPTESEDNQIPNESNEDESQDENQIPNEKNDEDMQDTYVGDAQKEAEQDLPVSHFLMNLILGKKNSDANENSESEAEGKQEETTEDDSCMIISKQEESLGLLPTENKVDDNLTFEPEIHDVKCAEETKELVKEESGNVKLDTERSIQTDDEFNKSTSDLETAAYYGNPQDNISGEPLSEAAANVSTNMETRDIEIPKFWVYDRVVDTVCQESTEASTNVENGSLKSSINDLTNTKASGEDTLGEGQIGLLHESLPGGKRADAVSEQTPLLTESGTTDAKDLSCDAESVQNLACAKEDEPNESSIIEATSTPDTQLVCEEVEKKEEEQHGSTATGRVSEEDLEGSNDNIQKSTSSEVNTDEQAPQITEPVSNTEKSLAQEEEISEASMEEREKSNLSSKEVENSQTAVKIQDDGPNMKIGQDKKDEIADCKTAMERETNTEPKSPEVTDGDQQLLVKKEIMIKEQVAPGTVENQEQTMSIKSNEEQELFDSKVQERDLNMISPREASDAEENFVDVKPDFSTDEEQSPTADAEEMNYDEKTKEVEETKNYTDRAATKTEAPGATQKTPKKLNLLSGVGSKVKHQLAKVKKAIVGKPGKTKPDSPKS